MNKGHIGVYEFCRRTGRDVTSVYKLIYSGKLPAIRKGPRKVWHIEEKQVGEWTKAASSTT